MSGVRKDLAKDRKREEFPTKHLSTFCFSRNYKSASRAFKTQKAQHKNVERVRLLFVFVERAHRVFRALDDEIFI